MSILEAIDLHKTYELGTHKVTALDGIDFYVKKGEFVSIMGPSGSGKSTLLHLLGGLDRPSEGEVTLANERLSLLNENQATLMRRHNIGFVFQFYNLLPTLTAAENILLPILIDGQDPSQYEERLSRILDMVGLLERRDHKPDQLSGGEQQRVSLARALITEPAIVLADEPTGNLDTKTGTSIMQLLRQSCEELDQAIVVVSHDPTASAYADRVVFLRDGRIVNELLFDEWQSLSDRRLAVVSTMQDLEQFAL